MEGSNYVDDDELDTYINESIQTLYDKLVTAHGEDYFLETETFSTAAGTKEYDLVTACGIEKFYKVRGVDVVFSDRTVSLKKFNFADRNKYQNVTSWHQWCRPRIRYRLQGQDLVFNVAPDAVYTVKVHVAPAFTKLVLGTDTFDAIAGWDKYVVAETARKMLAKEESDTSALDNELALYHAQFDGIAANRDDGEEEPSHDVYNDIDDDYPMDDYG